MSTPIVQLLAKNRIVTEAEKQSWNAKQDALVFDGEYNAETNKVATEEGVREKSVSRMEVLDDARIAKYADSADRPYSATLHNNIIKQTRVYTETGNYGGVYAVTALSSNGKPYIYNPWGFKSKGLLYKAQGWATEAEVVAYDEYIAAYQNYLENGGEEPAKPTSYAKVHKIEFENDSEETKGCWYTTATDAILQGAPYGSTSYHPTQSTVPSRQYNGQIRVPHTPLDSTDAASKGYVDTKIPINSISASRTVDNVLYRKKNGGAYDGMPLSFEVRESDSYVPYSVGGLLRGKTTDDCDGSTLVNKTYLNDKIRTVEAIAKGRATGYVFDTVADLDTWLENSENTENLVLGDNFYIKAVDVPDYWWDGTQKQELETQKVDLGEYAKTSDIPTDTHINNLIDAKLGAIENGTY